MDIKYYISRDIIPQDIYQDLRRRCGLSLKDNKAAQMGLVNSLYSISLIVNNQIIGMGRLIGDGGCFCQVVDICVVPEFQGVGLGKVIMENLVQYIKNELPKSCYVSLIADGNASFLYEQFGFRDTLPCSRGMFLTL